MEPTKTVNPQKEPPHNPLEDVRYPLLREQMLELEDSIQNRRPISEAAGIGLLALLSSIEEYSREMDLSRNSAEPTQEEEHALVSDPELVEDTKTAAQEEAFRGNDKMIVLDEITGNIFVEDLEGPESLLEEVGGTILGVYTQPEAGALVHTPLWGSARSQLSEDGHDTVSSELLHTLEFGKTYDVCYTKVHANGVRTETVDPHQTAGGVFVHIGTDRYINGALIFDRAHMLKPEEYFSGMRFNEADCRKMMTPEQKEVLSLAAKNDVILDNFRKLLRPELSVEELRQLCYELTEKTFREEGILFEYTEVGPAQLEPCFRNENNFFNHPDRVCYVPENWDFDDGPGITGNDIIDLCAGDKLKAEVLFSQCDWAYPSTVLDQWDEEDMEDLERIRKQREQQPQTLSDTIQAAREKATGKIQLGTTPEKGR